jgi:hypothetical protein
MESKTLLSNCVQLSVAVQSAPPQITLSWPRDGRIAPIACNVYRKKPQDPSWGPGTQLTATATGFVEWIPMSPWAWRYEYRL